MPLVECVLIWQGFTSYVKKKKEKETAVNGVGESRQLPDT